MTSTSNDGQQPLLLGTPNSQMGDVDACSGASTLTAWSQSLQAVILIAVTCRRWSCQFCGRRKVCELAGIVKTAKPNRLITLTVNPALHDDPRSAFDSTSKKIPRLIQQLRRSYGPIEYVRVLEITKAGWPHYHFLVRSEYIPQPAIRDAWQSLTGAHIVDVRQIKQQQDAYWYTVKYLAKQHYIPWTNRRVTISRHFAKKQPKKQLSTLDLTGIERSAQHPRRYIQWQHGPTMWKQIGVLVWQLEGQPPPTTPQPDRNQSDEPETV